MNKAKMENKFWIVDSLTAIQEGEGTKVSYYHKRKLVNRGFLEVNHIKGDGRGRPSVVYALAGKGRSYLALAKNWKRED